MNENAPLAPQKTNLAHSQGNDKGASDVNKQVAETPNRRRAPELESVARRNTLILESHRIAGGRIFIEKDDEGDRPAVVWHVDTEPVEGTPPTAPAPRRGTIDETPN